MAPIKMKMYGCPLRNVKLVTPRFNKKMLLFYIDTRILIRKLRITQIYYLCWNYKKMILPPGRLYSTSTAFWCPDALTHLMNRYCKNILPLLLVAFACIGCLFWCSLLVELWLVACMVLVLCVVELLLCSLLYTVGCCSYVLLHAYILYYVYVL